MSEQPEAPARNKPLILFSGIFLILNILSFCLRQWAGSLQVDFIVLFFGNCILFLATILSFYFYKKALNIRAQAFVRMVYSGMLVKMGLCVLAFLVYVLVARRNVNKGAIYGCFIFYFIYAFMEMKLLLQFSKMKKNA